MSDNFLSDVIAPSLGEAAQAIPAWQQNKLTAAHRAELDKLAQRHAQEQYNAQMRGLDIREQQALAQQHAAEARDAYNTNRLDQIDRQIQETGLHNRAMESRVSPTANKTPPNFVDKITGLANASVARNVDVRQKEGNTMLANPTTGKLGYGNPNTPNLTYDQALEQAFQRQRGMFPQYNVNPDSIRTELGLPIQTDSAPPTGNMPPRGGGMGDLRMLDRQTGLQSLAPDLSKMSLEQLQALRDSL